MKVKEIVPTVWRDVLARLPLPMLALAASYGVYRFALLFVPPWVAFVQAASFELVYLGLAVVRGLTPQQHKRARAISFGSVAVSVAYNTIDGLFHRRPDLLVDTPLWADVALSLLHGAPLAVVAYLVADLLLHSADTSAQKGIESPKAEALRGGRVTEFSIADLLGLFEPNASLQRDSIAQALGCSDATLSRLLTDAVQSGQLVREARGIYKLA